ncbi:MAG TPA: hypothetical protein VLG50_02260 [Candidatus Saccharimonadales bacterium]|nr:hypothetical protein [Candidatus Saccharimonadales bacterium]
MKKASAKIRNKIKTKFAQTINRLESTLGREREERRDRFRHHQHKKK